MARRETRNWSHGEVSGGWDGVEPGSEILTMAYSS